MRQSNEDFLSLYRLGINELNKAFSPKVSYITQTLLQSIFFMPLTHEEGHRAILTNEGIGSISKPYFNKNLAAYVTGVTDAQLINLRNSKPATFTRMYTAGLESDYVLALRESSLLNWHTETKDVLYVEYILRKLSFVGYYALGLLQYEMDVLHNNDYSDILNQKEEKNELERDIAGMDIYGAIHNLHHPSAEFHRYTNYEDLDPEEKEFVFRVGLRAYLNLIDPALLGKNGFLIKDKYLVNFCMGYTMAPFGDFIDEHFWLCTQSLKTHFYFRQYENKDTWFPAFGVDFADIPIANHLYSTIAVHGWSQPKDLAFTQTKGKLGGGIDLLCKYRFPIRSKGNCTGISIDLGIIAKTQGFLPEEVVMDKHFGIRFGSSFWFK
jgi:hypothetical protein